MVLRRAALSLVAVLLFTLTACAPASTPAATPTATPIGITSEEEAYVAAEATYRDYVSALNAYYAGDNPAYDPAEFLSGAPLDEERQVLEGLVARSLRVEGSVEVASVDRSEATRVADAWSVLLLVCLDYSGTRILDAEDKDVTPQRQEVLPLTIELATQDQDFVVVDSVVREEAKCSA